MWAELAPVADDVLARLPTDVDDSWGYERGSRNVLLALCDVVNMTTGTGSTVAPTLRRLRMRDLRRKRHSLRQCTHLSAAVYARRAREMYPNAGSGQVLLPCETSFGLQSRAFSRRLSPLKRSGYVEADVEQTALLDTP